MNISIEQKKAEAITRMKNMKMYEGVIEEFKNGKICESSPRYAACYWLTEEQEERVRKLEKEYDLTVYHVIHSYTDFGELENYLYVSDHEEDWEWDRCDIRSNYVMAYVYNKTAPELSEFGSIEFKVGVAGGLVRTA